MAAPGHRGEHLKPYHFKPGQTGNPGGRPKNNPYITKALAKLINDKDAAAAIATIWLKKTLEGDHRFLREMLDRIEGPVSMPAGETTADEDIATLREYLEQKGSRKKPKSQDKE